MLTSWRRSCLVCARQQAPRRVSPPVLPLQVGTYRDRGDVKRSALRLKVLVFEVVGPVLQRDPAARVAAGEKKQEPLHKKFIEDHKTDSSMGGAVFDTKAPLYDYG